ncbi:hypothetical protein LQ327_31525 [Actinomycetospora endophytica]|uniref:Outer membrane channel protein CpnT-like N-terminal domain-containing protein n=1 Tax=Actinomycetospora endophytica TaxID=2291215 RepID=A0ABS8PI25_9PSEU|nr:hypothetical protein [Actinomycetospora endophytica]MCD2197910.1 hypothetical protein [Actinomycetospora endophytica]
MGVDEIVSEVGLWWPSADEEKLREAARAWARMAGALDGAVDVGRAGAAQATTHWAGDAARMFAAAWQQHEQTLHDDAVGARALSAALTEYADAVADAKRRVEELAMTAGATIVAGVGLAWLTFGTSAAAAAGVSASLVAAASAIGVELSATAATIVAGALVGITFGAVEGAVVNMAVTQPLRVQAFHDGGYSTAEVATSATAGGLLSGALGGVAAGVRPVAGGAPAPRSAAEDLAELDSRITAALDPANRGALGPLFRVGLHETPTATFTPAQRPAATLLEDEGHSVHARPDPAALVRSSPADGGRLTELMRPAEPTGAAVENAILEANGRLARNGSGDIVVDARGTTLDENAAGEGLVAAITRIMSQGHEPPDSIRFVFDDRSIWFP